MIRAPRALGLVLLVGLTSGCFTEFPYGRFADGGPADGLGPPVADSGVSGPLDRGGPPRPDRGRPLGDLGPAGADARLGDAETDGPSLNCIPRDEVCDGADQDCDGTADEALWQPCPLQDGVCAVAEVQCRGGAWAPCDYAELVGRDYAPDELGRCDALDNDCDGAVDEDCDCEPGAERACGGSPIGRCRPGIQRCLDGLWSLCNGAVGPIEEACNGEDDDCDGDVDERLPEGVCQTGRPGVCATGDGVCVDGAIQCVPRAEPGEERCDGTDEDCDGAVDEGLGGDNCPAEGGACGTGRTACVDGFIVCQPAQPSDEVCNGFDDDCDGGIDEGLDGGACEVVAGRACLPGVLSCADGVAICQPQQEQLRDGVDEDCDGRIDEFPPELAVFDLADAAIGGLGVRPGAPPGFIMPHPGGLAANTFVPLPENALVDGVFVPAADGDSVVDTSGTTYDASSRVGDGNFWRPPAKGPDIVIRNPSVTNYRDRNTHSLLELHGNLGITFDLDAIAAYTGRPVERFQGRAGVSVDRVRWNLTVLVDGDRVERERHGDVREVALDVDVRGASRLTFIATDADDRHNWRHIYVGDPELTLGARP